MTELGYSKRYLYYRAVAEWMPKAQEASKSLRAREGLTQAQLAARLMVSQATISKIERCEEGVSLRTLMAVDKANFESEAKQAAAHQ